MPNAADTNPVALGIVYTIYTPIYVFFKFRNTIYGRFFVYFSNM